MGNRFFDFFNGVFPGVMNFNVGNGRFFIGGFSPIFLLVNIVASLSRIVWNWTQNNQNAQRNNPPNAAAQNGQPSRGEAPSAASAQNSNDAVFIIIIVITLLLFSWFLQKSYVCFSETFVFMSCIENLGVRQYSTFLRLFTTRCLK